MIKHQIGRSTTTSALQLRSWPIIHPLWASSSSVTLECGKVWKWMHHLTCLRPSSRTCGEGKTMKVVNLRSWAFAEPRHVMLCPVEKVRAPLAAVSILRLVPEEVAIALLSRSHHVQITPTPLALALDSRRMEPRTTATPTMLPTRDIPCNWNLPQHSRTARHVVPFTMSVLSH